MNNKLIPKYLNGTPSDILQQLKSYYNQDSDTWISPNKQFMFKYDDKSNRKLAPRYTLYKRQGDQFVAQPGSYNASMMKIYFDKNYSSQQKTPRTNTGFSTDRFDFEEHPMESARRGYNGSPTTAKVESPAVSTSSGASVPVVSNEWETKYNDLNTKYEQVLKELNELKNPTKPAETIEEPKNGNTYESLVQANTAAFNNGINSAYWRRNFRKSFNNALLNGNMYGINPNGSQVFDINGMNVSEMIQNIGGLDPRKGLTRRGMRLLKKQQKAYNGNIFENVNAKVRTLPFQEMNNQELDSLGQDALPQFQSQNHGFDRPFMVPTYEESDEGDIVNIGTKNIPFYQELKR